VDLDLCDVCYWRKRAEKTDEPHEDPRRTAYVVGLEDELKRLKETSIPVASAGEGRKLKHAIEQAKREGIIEGENEFARWIDRKGAIIFDSGEDETAVDALQRYRMGRGW
jgi:hypothetical protein